MDRIWEGYTQTSAWCVDKYTEDKNKGERVPSLLKLHFVAAGTTWNVVFIPSLRGTIQNKIISSC